MGNTLAIVYAPGETDLLLQILVKKMELAMRGLSIHRDNLLVHQDSKNPFDQTEKYLHPTNIVIGWGLPTKPDWSPWTRQVKTSAGIKQFVAVDLYEPYKNTERVLCVPHIKTGHFWRRTSWQTNCRRFLKGFWINHITPYGMKRIPIVDDTNNDAKNHSLTLGAPQQTEIVRMIFNFFVHYNYSLTEISNLLNAQGVMAPNKSKFWAIHKVKAILESAVYIGSNTYGACIKHAVFPTLIDRSTYCSALSKLYRK